MSFTRRRFMLASSACLLVSAPLFLPTGITQAAGLRTTATALNGFLELSRALTGHADLNPITSARILAALENQDSHFEHHVGALSNLLRPDQSAQQLLVTASDAGLRVPALTIVTAWYTGTIGRDAQAVSVSFYDALMFRPTLDACNVPSYCQHGPQGWVHPPPAVGVSAPV